jgi:hypothetical protein
MRPFRLYLFGIIQKLRSEQKKEKNTTYPA